MPNNTSTRYIVRIANLARPILCTDGEFHSERNVGPGGYSAKLYKTEAGARRARPGYGLLVETIQPAGKGAATGRPVY